MIIPVKNDGFIQYFSLFKVFISAKIITFIELNRMTNPQNRWELL